MSALQQALDTAVRRDNVQVVNRLLDSGVWNPDCVDTAVRRGNIDIVRLLMAKHAEDTSKALPPDLLDTAIRRGSQPMVAELLRNMSYQAEAADTAIRRRQFGTLELLLNTGQVPRSEIEDGIDTAIRRQADVAVDMLLRRMAVAPNNDVANNHAAPPLAEPQPTNPANQPIHAAPLDRPVGECVVCTNLNLTPVVFGCGHAVCYECQRQLQRCPECRATITARTRLFMSV